MNKNYLIIGGIALAGAGAYFLYKKKAKTLTSENEILQNQLDAEKENALKIIAQNKKKSSISLQNRNSNKSKIAVIQQAIGVASDGIVGPQTLNKLKTLFPNLVNLTNANIEQIYTFCNNNAYLTPNANNVDLYYGNVMEKPLIVPNNNSGINVFTDTFKPFGK
jgi:LPXTG-motif cell wall-anchored protein